jgi:excisionase family DNA binding protein
MIASLEHFSSVAPTPDDVTIAREASKRLEELRAGVATETVGEASDEALASVLRLAADIRGGRKSQTIPLPASVVRLVVTILHEMAKGKAVALLPCGAELTTEQAAQILNVSRPFVSKLVDEGKLPARKVGRNRRIRLEDLMAYKKQDDAARQKALADLAAMSQELDMGY